MYAHLNVWRLNEQGESSDDSVAREVALRLSAQPGFRSYTLVRTGEREVAALTVFDSREHLETALLAIADIREQRIIDLTTGSPQRREGPVVHHSSA